MAVGVMKTMHRFEVPIVLEHAPEGVIVSCDELNAVASGATDEEALRNLEQAFGALIKRDANYSLVAIRQSLR
jgi:predicted RNase H-like HicB family nuclease